MSKGEFVALEPLSEGGEGEGEGEIHGEGESHGEESTSESSNSRRRKLRNLQHQSSLRSLPSTRSMDDLMFPKRTWLQICMFVTLALVTLGLTVGVVGVTIYYSYWNGQTNSTTTPNVREIYLVDKSPGDPKQYRMMVLNNNLDVLLISKPDADQAAASMSVGVGHFSDPDNLPGLAHFLEHMLFMGTTKYPDENDYSKWISEHGGVDNAYTASEETNYYFEVNANFLNETLNRFAQFFIAPLLSEDSMAREVQAVNSENNKNLDNDDWRFFQLLKSLSNPAHPFHKFGTGNAQTLQIIPESLGIDVHASILEFYHQYYVASNMKLVVLGKESLDVLEQIVASIFIDVPDAPLVQVPITVPSFLPQSLQKLIYVQPISDRKELTVIWPIDPVLGIYVYNPIGGYISFLLGNEGEGSLLAYLKSQAYASSLWAGLYEDELDFALFAVSIELTPLGVEQADTVVTNTYAYINLMLNNIQSGLFNEEKQIEQIDWLFPEEARAYTIVSALSTWLHVTIAAHDIFYPPIETIFDGTLIKGLIQELSISNSLVFLTNRTFSTPFNQQEYWYHTNYSIRDFTSAESQSWKSASNSKLTLPPNNPYLINDTSLIPIGNNLPEEPFFVKHSTTLSVWYQWDPTFRTPRAIFNIHLLSPLIYNSLENYVYTQLFLRLLNDMASSIAYEAAVAGFTYSAGSTHSGISLKFAGFSQKLPNLVDYCTSLMATGTIQADKFNQIKNQYAFDLANVAYTDAWSQTMLDLGLLLVPEGWAYTDMLNALQTTTLANLESYKKCLFASFRAESLVLVISCRELLQT